ncbi:hypothetical protein WUBG_13983 [Wuchereria bancrofti]|uniref:Uncharacterized protein n=1 Tax=Wuchereria bancrofti TaxID=6293 RepID=J9EIA7_WUCBA|nr:hypothetical protein WUBG_13983 [Wuchereria bancrofti]
MLHRSPKKEERSQSPVIIKAIGAISATVTVERVDVERRASLKLRKDRTVTANYPSPCSIFEIHVNQWERIYFQLCLPLSLEFSRAVVVPHSPLCGKRSMDENKHIKESHEIQWGNFSILCVSQL